MTNQLYHETSHNLEPIVESKNKVSSTYFDSLTVEQIKQVIGKNALDNTFADFVRNARHKGELK